MLKSAIGLFVLAILILIFFLPSFTLMQDQKSKNREYQKKIAELEKEKLDLDKQIYLLEKDPVYLEKIARERMGLVREGEVIYRLSPMPAQK